MKQPLIFPLSNPTSQCEISAEDAYKFSKGQCVFAAGSPFGPVEHEGKTLYPGQANNVLCFPGVGFGAVLVKAKKVPPGLVTQLRVAPCGRESVAGCTPGRVTDALQRSALYASELLAGAGDRRDAPGSSCGARRLCQRGPPGPRQHLPRAGRPAGNLPGGMQLPCFGA